MATTTPNIGLTKPIGTEKYDLDVVNENSNIIDTEITDAKAGSNLRIFKVKNDLTDQDNAVSRVSGDSRYIQNKNEIVGDFDLAIIGGIYAYIASSSNIPPTALDTGSVIISQGLSTTSRTQILMDYANKMFIRFGNVGGWDAWSEFYTKQDVIDNYVNKISIQALHATDALRIAGQTLSLYKGDGSQENIALPEGGLGYSQTWQNVSASRATNITYTNTTGKPILVKVAINDVSNERYLSFVGGLNISGDTMRDRDAGYKSFRVTTTLLVPDGATYKIGEASLNVEIWVELR